MSASFKETLAELRPDDVRFILANQPRLDSGEDGGSISIQDQIMDMPDTNEGQDEEGRRRRHIEREWPEVGTILSSDYYGATYTAEIIPAVKRLKSGKQIRITSGPAQGTVCDSFSEAMITATDRQRTEQNLGRKGTSNGWIFWEWAGKPPEYNEARPDGDE